MKKGEKKGAMERNGEKKVTEDLKRQASVEKKLDEGAAEYAEDAQAGVVDERLGVADGPSCDDRSEGGEDPDVEGVSGAGARSSYWRPGSGSRSR